MGIFGRFRDKLRLREGTKEAVSEQLTQPLANESPNSLPLPPLPPPPLPIPAAVTPADSIQSEAAEHKPDAESVVQPPKNKVDERSVPLPEKEHTAKKIKDPFGEKDKSGIYSDNLDLVELFKRGEFSESETIRRQRMAIAERLIKMHIEPEAAKGILDEYAIYFLKDLEEVKSNLRRPKRRFNDSTMDSQN